MPEIIPNWHPALVHFPIALSITVTLLLIAGRLFAANALFTACARLLLPLAAVSALVAAGFGWQAFQTVEHDAAGHLVMLRHRNWAMLSSGALLLIALWDVLRQRAGKGVNPALLAAMLLLCGGFVFTGWLGGEMVYRHGVGVSPAAFAMPLPIAPTPPPPAMAPEAEPPAPKPTGGEHIHKDGKRHHH